VNQLQFAFINTDVQRNAQYLQEVQQHRFVAVTSFAMAAAMVATFAYALHASSAKSVITVAAAGHKPVASAAAKSATMPVATLDTVVVRPTAQQLAEIEQLRKTRVAKATTPPVVSVMAGSAAAATGL
jgi:hypothetical protein